MTDPISVSISDAVKLTGVGRSLLYKEIAEGRLPVLKVGRRTIILVSELRRWLASKSGERQTA